MGGSPRGLCEPLYRRSPEEASRQVRGALVAQTKCRRSFRLRRNPDRRSAAAGRSDRCRIALFAMPHMSAGEEWIRTNADGDAPTFPGTEHTRCDLRSLRDQRFQRSVITNTSVTFGVEITPTDPAVVSASSLDRLVMIAVCDAAVTVVAAVSRVKPDGRGDIPRTAMPARIVSL